MKHECRKICYKMNFEKKISKNETEKWYLNEFQIFRFFSTMHSCILKCNKPWLFSPIHMYIFHRYESSFRIVTVQCTVYTLFGNSVWMQYVIYLCMYTETISEKRWMDREKEREGCGKRGQNKIYSQIVTMLRLTKSDISRIKFIYLIYSIVYAKAHTHRETHTLKAAIFAFYKPRDTHYTCTLYSCT